MEVKKGFQYGFKLVGQDGKEQVYFTATKEEAIEWERTISLFIFLSKHDGNKQGNEIGGQFALEAINNNNANLLLAYLRLGIDPSYKQRSPPVCFLFLTFHCLLVFFL